MVISAGPESPHTKESAARTATTRTTRRFRRSPYLAIWPAILMLLVISPLVAPGSLSVSALQGTLPFAAVLAVVGIGQTLVIQQRGLDLSVPGVVSLSAILVTKIPAGNDASLLRAVAVVLTACVLAGLLSGVVVTVFGVTPLVATLGVNALLLGTIMQITNGSQTASAAPRLAAFALGSAFGVSTLVWVAGAIVVVVTFVVRSTTVGRRFVAIGTSAAAARAAGLPVRRYQALTYVVAAVFGGIAGIMIAGYLRTPGLSSGNNYLLPAIAAVVLGGTSLAGGAGSVLATAGGALFLTQLQQVVFGAGAPASVQLLIQSIAIGLGMALRAVPWRRLVDRLRRSRPPQLAAAGAA
jgi:ribose transport system permease protein